MSVNTIPDMRPFSSAEFKCSLSKLNCKSEVVNDGSQHNLPIQSCMTKFKGIKSLGHRRNIKSISSMTNVDSMYFKIESNLKGEASPDIQPKLLKESSV